MKLSLKLIQRRLPDGEAQIVAQCRRTPDAMRLQRLLLYDDRGPWQKNGAYVAEAEALPQTLSIPAGMALIVLGEAEPERFRDLDADVLLWRPGEGKLSVQAQFNRLSAIFQEYRDMEMGLLEKLAQGAPLPGLIALGEKLLNNPLLLMDEGYSLIVKPQRPNPLDWEPGKFHQAPTLSAETVDLIRMSREFRDRRQGMFYLSGDTLDCGVLFLQIRLETSSCLLALLEMERPITGADRQLLLYFSEHIRAALGARQVSRMDSVYFLQFLIKLLQNEKVELSEVNRQLRSQSWGLHDRYVCFVVTPDLWNQKDIPAYNLCRLMESGFRGCRAVHHEDRVVCVLNLDRAGLDREVFLQLLSQFVRDQILRVGVSYGFQDLAALPNYYRQALAALELGRELTPDEWNYRFEKYVLTYFLRCGTSQMEGRYLCHPDLLTLLRYDRENNTELLQTLKVYLDCGQNATATAAGLFIHRNTLYQRLNKIDALITDNLQNPDTRLYMQISYHIVDFQSV